VKFFETRLCYPKNRGFAGDKMQLKRLIVGMSVVALCVSAAAASPASAQVCAPTPTGTPSPQTYIQEVQGLRSANLIAYYPLNETSGSTATDYSTQSNNGTYSGPTLNAVLGPDGVNNAPSFDGTNDNVNLYTANFAADFTSAGGTIMVWLAVPSGVLTDSTTRSAVHMQQDTSNRILIGRTATNNQFRGLHQPSTGTTQTTAAITAWQQFVYTWTANGTSNLYRNGSYVNSATPGAWSGALSVATIGGTTNNWWSGNVAHVAIWNTVLTAGEVADLYTTDSAVPTATVTPACSTATLTNTPSSTPTNTSTPTATPTETPSSTPTNTSPATDTPTETPSSTPTNTVAGAPTDTPSNTPTETPTETPSSTPTDTVPGTATDTPSNTPTQTPTSTITGTLPVVIVITVVLTTHTPTETPDYTPTPTPTTTFSDVAYFPPPPGGSYGGTVRFSMDAGDIAILFFVVLLVTERAFSMVRKVRGKA